MATLVLCTGNFRKSCKFSTTLQCQQENVIKDRKIFKVYHWSERIERKASGTKSIPIDTGLLYLLFDSIAISFSHVQEVQFASYCHMRDSSRCMLSKSALQLTLEELNPEGLAQSLVDLVIGVVAAHYHCIFLDVTVICNGSGSCRNFWFWCIHIYFFICKFPAIPWLTKDPVRHSLSLSSNNINMSTFELECIFIFDLFWQKAIAFAGLQKLLTRCLFQPRYLNFTCLEN